jgi:Ca2+:H+ antiporter
MVQLVSCIVLLLQGRISILKTTLIGGILANILLLLGLAMFFGAIRRKEQYFNRTSSHTSSVLLSLASTSVLIPTASLLMGQSTESRVEKQSRGAAVMLIFVYFLYLYFCLHTHREVFAEQVQKSTHKAITIGPYLRSHQRARLTKRSRRYSWVRE